MAPQVLAPGFDKEMADYVESKLVESGIPVVTGVQVTGIERNGKVEKVLTSKQLVLDSADTDALTFGTYKYDMVLISGSDVSTFICFKDFIVGEEVHNLE